MNDTTERRSRETSLSEVLERIRADSYPEIDREVVRELLRLHAGDGEQDTARAVDDLIFARTGE